MPWVYAILVYVKTIQWILGVAQQEKLCDIEPFEPITHRSEIEYHAMLFIHI